LIIEALNRYPEIEFAFLFLSVVKQRMEKARDLDIAASFGKDLYGGKYY
jgi:hypothetical protein